MVDCEGFAQPIVNIEHRDLFGVETKPKEPEMYFDVTESGEWLWKNEEPQPRPRPSYSFLVKVQESSDLDPILASQVFSDALDELLSIQPIDHTAIAQAGVYLASTVQRDMKWEQALNSENRYLAIAAFNAERDSLLDSILELLDPKPSRL